MLHGVDKILVVLLSDLVTSPCVGVIVYPRVSGKLIGAGEFLAAARELASMWFLSGMCSNVSGLVLKAVEGLIAERALVRSR